MSLAGTLVGPRPGILVAPRPRMSNPLLRSTSRTLLTSLLAALGLTACTDLEATTARDTARISTSRLARAMQPRAPGEGQLALVQTPGQGWAVTAYFSAKRTSPRCTAGEELSFPHRPGSPDRCRLLTCGDADVPDGSAPAGTLTLSGPRLSPSGHLVLEPDADGFYFSFTDRVAPLWRGGEEYEFAVEGSTAPHGIPAFEAELTAPQRAVVTTPLAGRTFTRGTDLPFDWKLLGQTRGQEHSKLGVQLGVVSDAGVLSQVICEFPITARHGSFPGNVLTKLPAGEAELGYASGTNRVETIDHQADVVEGVVSIEPAAFSTVTLR